MGTAAGQLNVPGSPATGAAAGEEITAPASPHAPHAGPQAGSCIGVPQAGWQGCGWGAAQGAPPPMHGERNSMNEGRRQLLPPPKQLLHPGAAARLPRAITRHRDRHMIGISTTVASGSLRVGPRSDTLRRPRRRLATLAHDRARGRMPDQKLSRTVPRTVQGRPARPCRSCRRKPLAADMPAVSAISTRSRRDRKRVQKNRC